jgi:hypothetical protein
MAWYGRETAWERRGVCELFLTVFPRQKLLRERDSVYHLLQNILIVINFVQHTKMNPKCSGLVAPYIQQLWKARSTRPNRPNSEFRVLL